MPNITPEVMAAFLQELEKCAFVPSAQLTRGGIALGSGLTGATIGGLYQGKKRYSQARAEGASVGGALGAGLKGGVVGAGIGGAVGAGAGAALPGVGRTVRDFGGQTLHMWTGAGGKHGLQAFNSGAAQTAKRLEEAATNVAKARSGELADPRFLARFRKPIDKAGIQTLADKAHVDAGIAHKAMLHAEDLGLTSLPGAVKAFATRPGEAARGAVGAMVHGASRAQQVAAVGIPGGMAAYGALHKPKEGETRLGNIAGSVGQAVPMMMPWMPTSIALSMLPGMPNPGMAASNALGRSGKAVGNVVQRAVSPGQVQPANTLQSAVPAAEMNGGVQ